MRNTSLTWNNGARAVLLLAALLLAGCAGAPARHSQESLAAILAAPDRSAPDRANDARRKSAQLYAFVDARPGQRVLDLGAGGGYTTELLARMVGAEGRVWAQNNRYFIDNFVKTRMAERMSSPAMRNVEHAVREFDDPVPAGATGLDLVTFLFVYHDLGWVGADRARLNRAVFAALRSGGHYVIADHSGRPGTGIGESKSLHRVEEALVRREVEAAGFVLVEQGQFLRNPADPRDRSVFKPAQPNDEFVLKFRKP